MTVNLSVDIIDNVAETMTSVYQSLNVILILLTVFKGLIKVIDFWIQVKLLVKVDNRYASNIGWNCDEII